MKNLILINGTMGSGKTATSLELKKLLPKCVFLDGDWCWHMSPFVVTEETKEMVQDNITHLLNNFLRCSEFENVIFCWVMHTEEIIDNLLTKIDTKDVRIRKFTIMVSEDTLKKHIGGDIELGIRSRDVLTRSIERLPLYEKMDTEKIYVDDISAKEAAEKIERLV